MPGQLSLLRVISTIPIRCFVKFPTPSPPVALFIMLSFYQYKGRGDSPDRWLLHWAFLTYSVALVTDFLDGYLARKWKIESGFGRIVDPFVDKILVLGSFIFFAGKNFIIPEVGHPNVVKTITGVAPGIVVILL